MSCDPANFVIGRNQNIKHQTGNGTPFSQSLEILEIERIHQLKVGYFWQIQQLIKRIKLKE